MRECAAGDRSVHQIAQLCLLAAAAPQGEMFTCSLLNKGQKQALISLGKIHGGDTTGTTHCMGKIQLSGTGKAQDKSKVSNSGGAKSGSVFELRQNPAEACRKPNGFHQANKNNVFCQVFSVPTCDSTYSAL